MHSKPLLYIGMGIFLKDQQNFVLQ
uniref:Uncharacterized protein n=1 Tax=Arundo donax TaxID=35708 RepID=A0A0A9AUJ3_ARUDO